MRAIFALLVLAVFAFLGASAQTECGENETFQRCGTGCERTCNNGEDWDKPCSEPCVDKCFCQDGFLRDDTGSCVRAWRCSPTL
ncbi:cysteine-rich venom protein 6-like [Anopheles funestus]|uniref:TIL domain-containing protein n=1 Tax=Anopheles funestus TaxID=62324 RepID=A0A182RDG1_ANOFN|nr:cysteine-rich venom protein 6-like [Anopheles funestus]XP_049295859.1 cysteine-rich venom protein 6-like [Anopheles funestus]XP_049295860.1 cysteine-rich venom protein 6-like [Anopheles funestus]